MLQSTCKYSNEQRWQGFRSNMCVGAVGQSVYLPCWNPGLTDIPHWKPWEMNGASGGRRSWELRWNTRSPSDAHTHTDTPPNNNIDNFQPFTWRKAANVAENIIMSLSSHSFSVVIYTTHPLNYAHSWETAVNPEETKWVSTVFVYFLKKFFRYQCQLHTLERGNWEINKTSIYCLATTITHILDVCHSAELLRCRECQASYLLVKTAHPQVSLIFWSIYDSGLSSM